MEKETNPAVVFSKDKPVMVLAVISSLLAFANLILVIALLRSHDFKVPVQYVVNDGSVLQTSDWYSLFSLGVFAVFSAVVVLFSAHRIHKTNRVFSIGVLLVYSVISVISILTTYALLDLVSGV